MYTSLIENTHTAAAIIFGLAVVYFFLGLLSPAWARASGRGSVVLRSLLGVFIAAGLYIGVIVYTHTQPDGPHSLDMYIKSHDWEQYRSEGTPGHAAPTEQPAGDGR
jgi:hypothetical protein